MATATYDLEASLPRRSWFLQLLITLFLGIPMTLALTIGLAFYCLYECVKFAFSAKSPSQRLAHSEEHAFTSSLTKFARIHGPSQPVESAAEPAAQYAKKDDSPISTADKKN
jgi:hypothetical protein